MKIEILLFAQLRDAFGSDRLSVEARDGLPISDVVADAIASSGHRELLGLPLRYAVGNAFVAGDYVATDGETVALIPPVSGG